MIRSLPPWMRIVLTLSVLVAVAYPVFTRDNVNKAPGRTRGTAPTAWPPASVKIAVPWPSEFGRITVPQGVQLALEELNASDSPLAGKVVVANYVEPDEVRSSGDLSRRIADDPDVVAVIGHESSEAAMLAAVTYETKGILHLSPMATLPRLTHHRFQYTFRLVPNDDVVAAALVEYARTHGWKHIGILYSRIEESEALAQEFSLRAIQEGLVPAYFRSYLPEPNFMENDFRPLLASTTERPADAILLADRNPWAAKMLVDMQTMGFKQPVLAGDALDSSATIKIADRAAERVVMAAFVDPESSFPAYAAFRERFLKRFKVEPGYGAAQGYEAMRIFIKAVEMSKSTAPIVVATTIRTNVWDGIFGRISFTKYGDVEGRNIVIKRFRNGRIVTEKELKTELIQ